MAHNTRIVFSAVLLICLVLAQAAFPQGGSFFKTEELMRIGVYYYPEAWPQSQWARDIVNIKKMGLEFVHIGEFAWAFMEPEEGKFQFDWLETNVRLCGEQGLKVVLCTPSPTPPIWLVSQHPEVLMVDASGRRMAHGSREHACWSVDLYRQYVAKIVTELAKRFGNNPDVWGWQIDNEVSHYDKSYCYCDSCQSKFRAWLKRKYGTIEYLNRDWGNAFWSQMYQDFEQVRIPNESELVAQMNPHAVLDFQRWFAEEAADYIRFQADILRKNTHNQWITTNFMNLHSQVYPPLSGKDLDIITWTLYPVHGNANQGPLGYRLGSGSDISFMHDFTRSINGFQGLMELQPGQVNWGNVNPQPYPGAIYMWIMRAFGGGAKIVCTYRYRQPLYGGELYHNGLVETDGVTPSSGGKQYVKAAADMVLLRKHFDPNAKEPERYAKRRTGLLYNVDNRWDMDNHKQTERWDSMGHVLKYYSALKRLGCPVDVISEDKEFSKYPFLVAPAYQLLDEALVNRWTKYVQDGGHLILSCRTGQKDRRGQLWEKLWAGPIYDLIGASIPFYDVLPEPITGQMKAGNKPYTWISWGDVLEPAQGTLVLATYADQFYAGKAAAVTRKLGQGSVTYIGVDSLNGTLEADLLKHVFEKAGVAIEFYDDQFIVDWRNGFWIATNFTEKVQWVPFPEEARFLIGSRKLDPAGVAVWKEAAQN